MQYVISDVIDSCDVEERIYLERPSELDRHSVFTGARRGVSHGIGPIRVVLYSRLFGEG